MTANRMPHISVWGFVFLLAIFCVSLSAADGLEQARNATVFIQSTYRPVNILNPEDAQLARFTGTGFVIADEGLILTNAHVVQSVMSLDIETDEPATDRTPIQNRRVLVLHQTTVRLASGTEHSLQLDATVLATHHPNVTTDLALLRVYPRVPLPTALLANDQDMAQLKQGMKVRSLGFPKALNFGNAHGPELVLHSGDIAALHRDENGHLASLNHDAKIDHGNSGGPLIDEQGRVIGINTFGIGKQDFSIPMTIVRREFGEVIKHRGPPASGRRTLTVGNDARATHASVKEAMEAARPGDTVLLGEGRFLLDEGFPIVSEGVWLRGLSRDRTTLVLGNTGGLTIGPLGYHELSDMTVTVDNKTERNKTSDTYYVSWFGGSQSYLHDLSILANRNTEDCLLMIARDTQPNIYNCRIENFRYPSMAVGVGTGNYLLDIEAFKHGPKFHRVTLSGARVYGKATFEGSVFLPTKDVMSEGPFGRGTPIFQAVSSNGKTEITMIGCLRPAGSVWHATGKADFRIVSGRIQDNVFHFNFGDPQADKKGYRYLHMNSVLGIYAGKQSESKEPKIVGNYFICTGDRAPTQVAYIQGHTGEQEVFMPGSAVKIFNGSPAVFRNYFLSCLPIHARFDGSYDKLFDMDKVLGNVYYDPTVINRGK